MDTLLVLTATVTRDWSNYNAQSMPKLVIFSKEDDLGYVSCIEDDSHYGHEFINSRSKTTL